MQDAHDSGKRKRPLAEQPQSSGKKRLVVELDEDIADHFLQSADRSDYHTLINAALREHIDRRKAAVARTVKLGKGQTLGSVSLRKLLEEDSR